MRVPAFEVVSPVLSGSPQEKWAVEQVMTRSKKPPKSNFYQGILGVSEEPLVDRDFIGNSNDSGIVRSSVDR